MVDNGCRHFENYVNEFGLDTIMLLDGCFAACVSYEARDRKATGCCCFECGSFGLQIFSCLHCIFFGCKGPHIIDHLKSKKHILALDLSHGILYCNSCKQFIYDNRCQEITDMHRIMESEDLQKSLPYNSWRPSATEVALLTDNPKRRFIRSNYFIGLRGLVNLGATCFMNCIVQVLVHTPLLSDFFLSDLHECDLKSLQCLVCEVSHLFQEFYSGTRGPISLHRMLYLIWNHAKHLADCEQKDAHEFFIATLEILHKHCLNAKSEGEDALATFSAIGSINSSQCKCIIDQIFAGMLQSDVVCQACKNVSTTNDPFWDISLDLGESDGGAPPKSLIDCLDRYTKAEHLGSDAKIKCSACKSYEESTKKLSFRTLPIVACFHFKRFKHSSAHRKKIASFISFPAELDMTPFMSEQNDQLGDYRYSLYAVVNHIGTMDTGHYIAYVRLHNETWVKCDDHILSTVGINQVLDTEGYLLFYHKAILEYE